MELKKICVITAVCGNYNAHVRSIDHLNVDGYIFGDATNLKYDGSSWTRCTDCYFHHDDPYIRYKYYKCQWHNIPMLDKYDIIVWIDSTLELKKIPYDDLDKHDIVMYKHNKSRNTHQELRLSRDARFQPYKDGMMKQRKEACVNWVAMGGFIVSKRCEKIYELNDKWFSKIKEFSPQCQVSFPGVFESTGSLSLLLKVDIPVCDPHIESECFKRYPHLTEYEDYRK